jgi:hypothetical protein
MTVRILFFVGLSGIKLSFPTGRGERFANKFLISNDRTVIEKLVQPYKANIGSVEHRFLTEDCPNLIYSDGHVADDDVVDLEKFARDSTIASLSRVQQFLHSLWVVKDNAAFEDRGWTITLLGPTRHHIHNNHWNARKFMADGSRREVQFDRNDLRLARLAVPDASPRYLFETGDPTALTEQAGRVSRFVYFVQCARDTDDIALKIVQYFSALEALVSSSSAELTHQVSERVASLLEPPGQARIALFQRLRRGYGIRSQAVHGSGFRSKSQDALRNSAIEVDETCRIILRKIYSDNHIADIFDLANENFASFFHNLILGDPNGGDTEEFSKEPDTADSPP